MPQTFRIKHFNDIKTNVFCMCVGLCESGMRITQPKCRDWIISIRVMVAGWLALDYNNFDRIDLTSMHWQLLYGQLPHSFKWSMHHMSAMLDPLNWIKKKEHTSVTKKKSNQPRRLNCLSFSIGKYLITCTINSREKRSCCIYVCACDGELIIYFYDPFIIMFFNFINYGLFLSCGFDFFNGFHEV